MLRTILISCASLVFLGACMTEAEKEAIREELFLLPGAGVERVSNDFAASELERICVTNRDRLRDALPMLQNRAYTYRDAINLYTDNRYALSVNIRPVSLPRNEAFCSIAWAPTGTVENARDAIAAAVPDAELRINTSTSIVAFLYGEY